ncbi:MAG: hypothetical protein ABJE80_22885 [Reichenbachiella sp.]|uniref:hypothetical protein n=1 Tax=Reichenbachiella sp. TaxID=2184521 RepID=UPI003266D868
MRSTHIEIDNIENSLSMISTLMIIEDENINIDYLHLIISKASEIDYKERISIKIPSIKDYFFDENNLIILTEETEYNPKFWIAFVLLIHVDSNIKLLIQDKELEQNSVFNFCLDEVNGQYGFSCAGDFSTDDFDYFSEIGKMKYLYHNLRKMQFKLEESIAQLTKLRPNEN